LWHAFTGVPWLLSIVGVFRPLVNADRLPEGDSWRLVKVHENCLVRW
jgi:hypothetical protein